MKKRIFLYIGLFGLTFCMTGCGNKTESAAEVPVGISEDMTEAATVLTTEEITTEEEVVKSIGKPETGAYEIHMTNTTGQPVIEFWVKASEDTEYSGNLLDADDVFAEKEERILYYKDQEERDSENPAYDIRIVYEDGNSYELHDLPFEDFTECKLCFEDEIVFLTYTSISDKKSVSTKDAEIARKEAENTPAPSNGGGSSGTAAPIPAEQPEVETTPTTQAPSAETPNTMLPSTEVPVIEVPEENYPGDEGCLDDGLVY